MVEKNEWQQFLENSRVKPPFYLGGIHNFLMRNSISSPLELAFSPSFFDTTAHGVLYVSRSQYVWTFDSCGVTNNIMQRSRWDKPVLLQELLQLDVDLRSEKKPPVFHQAKRILWGTFCNFLFADTSFISLRLNENLLSQHYTKGVPDDQITISNARQFNCGLVFGAKLNKDWFRELPFDMSQIKQNIPKRLTNKVEVIWKDDFDMSDFTL